MISHGATSHGALPVVITPGEPAGIGAEITLAAWADHRSELPAFALIEDPSRLTALAKTLGIAVPVVTIDDIAQATAHFADALPVLATEYTAPIKAGHPDPANAATVIAAIEQAVALVQSGKAAAVVTNPIQKSSLHAAGFKHPGHTEFLAELAGPGVQPVMMLACPELRVVPATIHVALTEAPRLLSRELIVELGRITAEGLARDFAIPNPRIAVAGLNPHAGEEGGMGREEIDMIRPAVEDLKKLGIDAFGPEPPDTMFHAEARARYDAALCMYHDQALIPIKTVDFWGGINVTLGLPFVRTSPDHGTGLAIAGTGTADCRSLVAAIGQAARMAARRAAADLNAGANSKAGA
ncbi:MAG: 4-hydroxythreonine-4-phosphate dehydrogenase PdxA [Rhodospirillaceae bacterium]|jgi:4-hydroxythreonine-4-phosphate dehydrogenase|nr:4-hydroxythreonine-4-phosphate dehydrogenase PdxA [Rhodospirillaceae bacterium]MBT6139472.1 4-hydroxythreonine-4-phosphate dehydrogenase PdxA [Rhodospirillaceae bacterium]